VRQIVGTGSDKMWEYLQIVPEIEVQINFLHA